ncbi:MAG: hypothetical protein ACI9TY_000983 [Alphaproteobacteria bacterium]|jgi:hypothetical protein
MSYKNQGNKVIVLELGPNSKKAIKYITAATVIIACAYIDPFLGFVAGVGVFCIFAMDK